MIHMTMEASSVPVSSTQYNDISDAYQELYPSGGEPSSFVLGSLEEYQLKHVMTSSKVDIRGQKVLDLACGAGFYTSRWAVWGAASVTGVDISRGMVEAAQKDAKERGIPESKLRYQIGDATSAETVIQDGPVDIVTGTWLLNYAPDSATMTKMWQTIGRNLKSGGFFVGLTISPLLTDLPYEEDFLNAALSESGVWGKHGNQGRVIKKLESGQGYYVEIELVSPKGGGSSVKFENYYLTKEIFDASCRDSGMFEGLEWQDFIIPEELKRDKPVGYWNDMALSPSCRVCVAKRV